MRRVALRGHITVAAVLAVGVGAAGLAALDGTPRANESATSLVASITECHDMVGISISGRGNGLSKLEETDSRWLLDANGDRLPASTHFDDGWLDRIHAAQEEAAGPGSYAMVSIGYPANMGTYHESVTTGVSNAEHVMRAIAATCPNTRFAIVGYSMGADVARRLAMNIGNQATSVAHTIVDPNSVLGVVIIADPGRSAGEGPFPGARDPFRSPDGYDVAYQQHDTPTSGQGALTGTAGSFGALAGRVASFCSEGDLTCAAPENAALVSLVVNLALQMHIDSIEFYGPTPDTAAEFTHVLTRAFGAAFDEFAAQPNWLATDETFLDVLVTVSDPAYVAREYPERTPAESAARVASIVHLPRKLLLEVSGLVLDNRGTIDFLMTDAYEQTFAPITGHHFDYWHDAEPDAGRTSSVDYAAAWLAHLAAQASTRAAGPELASADRPAPDVTEPHPMPDEASSADAASSAGDFPDDARSADDEISAGDDRSPAANLDALNNDALNNDTRDSDPQDSDAHEGARIEEDATDPPDERGAMPVREDRDWDYEYQRP